VIKRRKPLKRSTKPIPKVSARRRRQRRIYDKAGPAFIAAHPCCEVCWERPTTQRHHKGGRNGELLNKTEWFLAVCNACHDKITNNGRWAKENGYKL
jgi:hypothetical protein